MSGSGPATSGDRLLGCACPVSGPCSKQQAMRGGQRSGGAGWARGRGLLLAAGHVGERGLWAILEGPSPKAG